MSYSLHEPTSPGLLDRLEELLAETVRSRSDSNHTLQLVFEVCNAQRESLAALDGWVDTRHDQVDSCHAKLDALTAVCKQQFNDLQSKADNLATTLESGSAVRTNANPMHAGRTSGDPLEYSYKRVKGRSHTVEKRKVGTQLAAASGCIAQLVRSAKAVSAPTARQSCLCWLNLAV